MAMGNYSRDSRSRGVVRQGVLALLGLCLCLVGCNSGGSSGSISPPSPTQTPPQLEQQAVMNLLELQRVAVLQEDVDRLQGLLQGEGGAFGGQSYLEAMAATFRHLTVIDLQHTDITLHHPTEPFSVSLRETLSVIDPRTFEHRTRSVQATWRLAKQTSATGTVTLLIAGVTHAGPTFELATRGQVQAGVPVRLAVRETGGTWTLAGGEVEVPETGVRTALRSEPARLVGSFTPPLQPQPQAVRVRLRNTQGQEITVAHRYRLRVPGEGAVGEMSGTGVTRFYSVTTAGNGTVWAGGDGGGALYQVRPGETRARLEGHLLEDPSGRVEDLAFDRLGRLHAIVFSAQRGGDIVLDRGVFCQTVNASDSSYPFKARDPRTGILEPSASTRALPAEGGNIWLFGSDDGVAQVTDAFRNGQCPPGKVEVRYDPIFRRGVGGLLSNTVPALVAGADGSLWFGTAFGLTRLQQGQFAPVPFDPALSLRGNVTTLEAFFREVAEAIFTATPVSAVRIGEVSFVDIFGSSLSKEDVIFSLAEDAQGRIWAGTLGGGVRRIEASGGSPRQTLHLTRQGGLGSNIIFALAVGPDGSIWAASEEGVSRIQEAHGTITITNFSAMDGLRVPVRDVAVARDGTVWLATDGGLFRITTAAGIIRGVVRDAAGRPVVGAEVRVLGTPFRTITDAEGRYVLVNLPPGSYQLLIDGTVATGGPFTASMLDVVITVEAQTLPPIAVVLRSPATRLIAVSGNGQSGTVGLPLADPLVVGVQDAEARGIAGVPVTFTVIEGGGALASEVVITDVNGLARNSLTIMAAGTLQVAASAEGPEPVVFTATGVGAAGGMGAIKPRLISVSGNNQSAEPGQELPEPLVVRLEDQFGNPLPGQTVTAEIIQGDGMLTSAQGGGGSTVVATTDERGEASFRLQVGGREEDVVVRVSAPEFGQSVQFLAIVGAVDTPDIPRDLAVTGSTVYIADRFSGLQIIDVSDPIHPRRLASMDLEGSEERLALAENRLYVAADFPPQLYILDIINPSSPVVLGSVDLPAQVHNHAIAGVAVQGGFAYVVTDDRVSGSGTLQVVNIGDPAQARVEGNVSYASRPADIAVSGNFAYVPTGSPGLLIFNISDSASPGLQGLLEGVFLSSIALSGDFAYAVELLATGNRFTALDLRNPAAPQRRGTVQTPEVFQLDTRFPIAVAGRFAYLVEFAMGLEAIDISMPDAPRPVGRIDTPSQALNVAATDDFIYVTDLIFGLQVIRGPGAKPVDTDGDGVIDFFDAFPRDPTEAQDTDGDGMGDNADPDDDNDGFTDGEELQAKPPADPKDPRIFPVRLPPPNTTTIVVDAASPFSPRARDGTPEAPYRSITEALRAIRALHASGVSVQALLVGAGKYSPLTTQEIFPLSFFQLPALTMKGAGRETTVIDAAFTADVITLISKTGIVIEGFTLTHGAHGLLINTATALTLRQNRITENAFSGIEMGINSKHGNIITENIVDTNGLFGIHLFENSAATITSNSITGNAEDGVFVVIGSTAEITTNTISGNGIDGVGIRGNSTATITKNRITRNNREGIFVLTESSAEINANIISENGLDGIEIQDNSESTITGNLIANNVREGIFVLIKSGAKIHSNIITHNGLDGIEIQNNSESSIIGNTIANNSRIGVFALVRSKAEIINNIITDNEFDGIEIKDISEATISGNTITKNSRIGVFTLSDSAAILSDNIVSENGQDGIHIRDGSFAAINGGSITQNVKHGVFLAGASVAAIGFLGDVLLIAQNGGSGIFVTDDGSLAQLDLGRIVLDDNGGGDIVGPFIDFLDSDLDGLSDQEEVQVGTDPRTPDSDGDAFSDGVEVVSDSDPLVPSSVPTMILYGAAHVSPEVASTFYAIDPKTARAVRVGSIGFRRVRGTDVDANGALYATGVSPATGEHVLLTINPTTGAGTAVGATGIERLGFDTVTDLSFRRADNALYVYFGPGDTLGTVDLLTGMARVSGSTGVFCCGNGLAFSPQDVLFHANDNALHILNQASGTATVVAGLRFAAPADQRPRINAMDFQPGTGILFASLNDGSDAMPENYLATINTTNGEVTIIGRTVDGLDALAWFFVP